MKKNKVRQDFEKEKKEREKKDFEKERGFLWKGIKAREEMNREDTEGRVLRYKE